MDFIMKFHTFLDSLDFKYCKCQVILSKLLEYIAALHYPEMFNENRKYFFLGKDIRWTNGYFWGWYKNTNSPRSSENDLPGNGDQGNIETVPKHTVP